MRRAFVSHSTADDCYVAEMESFLRAAGFDDVFNDVGSIAPGAEFWPEIEKGIAAADTLVVVITAASNGSEWVKREVEYALRLSRKLIPVWIEDCPVPAFLKNRDVIDFRPRTREARRIDISRIIRYAPAELIGRDAEKKLLSEAWAKTLRGEAGRPTVVTFVALGGEGKTSLVAKWAVDELLAQGWPGCDAAFAWSFYSQGTREQLAASSDLFLKAALTFFGDDADQAFAASPAGAFEKGQRLARLVGQRRSLLILDGLEPLQYAPTAPTPGQLKDQGIAALLRALAAASHGLCVVTTRYSLPDLKAFWQTTAPEKPLLRLSKEAGVHLLQQLGVRKESGSKADFQKLVEDVKGHALTLTLLGGFLKRAFHGDIRQRDRVQFEKADEKMDGGHAFRTMAAYEQWLLRDGGDEGRREVAVLRLMGLFDRPADAGCLAALRRETIPGLTEPLAGLADDDWEYCLSGLETTKLLTVNRDASGALVSLDAHPHLREYFARQLRTQQPDAWRAAHRRLYEHLFASTPDKPQPTLEDLQPLYQAIVHGCAAEEFSRTYREVFDARILRGSLYSIMHLGAVQSDMGAMAGFFSSLSPPRINPNLETSAKGFLLKHQGYCFRASGRLHDAEGALGAASKIYREAKDISETVVTLGLLCSTQIFLGNLSDAAKTAEEQTALLQGGDPIWIKFTALSRLAEVSSYIRPYHECIPLFDAAFDTFCDAGADRAKNVELLYSAVNDYQARSSIIGSLARWGEFCVASGATEQVVNWAELVEKPMKQKPEFQSELHKGLMSLFIAQAYVTQIEAIPNSTDACDEIGKAGMINCARNRVEDALKWLRSGSRMHELPRALFCRGRLRFLTGARIGPESAQADLDEAWEIAERGPMPLFLADIHLHRARLFGISSDDFRMPNEDQKYPWDQNPDGSPRGPNDDLAEARHLIFKHGYLRRKEELEDAEAALSGK